MADGQRRAVPELVGVGAVHVDRIVVPRALERDVVVTLAPARRIVELEAEVPSVRRWIVSGPSQSAVRGVPLGMEAEMVQRGARRRVRDRAVVT